MVLMLPYILRIDLYIIYEHKHEHVQIWFEDPNHQIHLIDLSIR